MIGGEDKQSPDHPGPGIWRAFLSRAFAWQFGAPGDKFDPHHHDALFEYPDPTKEAPSDR
jgi:hypothetical protein